MNTRFVTTNDFRNALPKSSNDLNAGVIERIVIGPNDKKITMYAEPLTKNDENYPEVTIQDGREYCGAIFSLVTNFKEPIVFTSSKYPDRPRMILRPYDSKVKPCLASILNSISKRKVPYKEDKILMLSEQIEKILSRIDVLEKKTK